MEKREIGESVSLLIHVRSRIHRGLNSGEKINLPGVEKVVEENPEIELFIVEFGITGEGAIPGLIY